MIDLSVIILVGREERHIRRCLEKLAPLEPRQVFVVESQKGDRTHEIAESMGATTVWHDWPGLYAPQMNWAFDNLPIESEWVMRLDADEYFLPEAIEEIKEKLPNLPADVTGVISKRRHYIFGGWAKHGTYPVKLLRIFRKGKGFCEERYMDEHIQLKAGHSVEFDFDFVDHNLNSFAWWCEKHRGYAKREARDAFEIMDELRLGKAHAISIDGQAGQKRLQKYRYYSLPPYFRVLLYWGRRYVVGRGVLDGWTGLMWNGFQGFWYRWICDVEICRMMRYSRVREFAWRVVAMVGFVVALSVLSPLILAACILPLHSKE